MPDQPPRNIICPICGNTNSWSEDLCRREGCGFDLRLIKQQILGAPPAAGLVTTPAPATLTEPREPTPPLPELPERGSDEPIARLVASRRFLIPGLGDRADEIAARFFMQVDQRGIDGVERSVGKLVIQLEGERTVSRDYYFVERDLGDGALATMAVWIARTGTDLFVEWRGYTTPPWRTVSRLFSRSILAAILAMVAFVSGPIALIGLLILTVDRSVGTSIVLISGSVFVASVVHPMSKVSIRGDDLVGFQGQESTAFQLSIRSALMQAIHDAGITDSLVRGLDGPRSPNEPLI